MNHTMAKTASGKACVGRVCDCIMEDILEIVDVDVTTHHILIQCMDTVILVDIIPELLSF